MEKIAVVANEKAYAEYLRNNLNVYFEEYAEIKAYSLFEVEQMEFLTEEFVVVSAFTIFHSVKKKLKESSELIILSLALTKENIKPLETLTGQTRALLVNIDYRTCMQVITNIYSVGLRNLELTPYWGEGDYDRSIRIAVTPDEEHLVPPGMEKVINIGSREIELNCIIDLADALGLEGVLQTSRAFRARKKLFYGNASMEKVLGENDSLTERVNALIKLMDQGIIITDVLGRIHLCNKKAEELLRSRSEFLTGLDVLELLPEARAAELVRADRDTREELIHVEGETLVVSVTQIVVNEEIRGKIITLDNFKEIETKQHKIRSRLHAENHLARYRFEDIKGNSETIIEAVTAARRMAKFDSSVLIYGESGTGKEIFAQSIHNASPRSNFNFVAVNCAAIPENLLESEMFGYEEGSFTGAKRGGKIGYFELAHLGTIFLDEIAEMPLLLQSKLLRVIEERKIIKIGSPKIVDIDVRIIAASNKNLSQKVAEGSFREDLYYRLNVLPLYIPPLRERKVDIMLLAAYFMEQLGCRFTFGEKAEALMRENPWQGNIRELRNTVEYLSSLEKETIDEADLPFAHYDDPRGSRREFQAGMQSGLQQHGFLGVQILSSDLYRFLLREGSRAELFQFILGELETAYGKKTRMGRTAISKTAEEKGLFFTEPEIRKGLLILSENGFVKSSKGRGGSVITEKGRLLAVELAKYITF